MNSVTQHLPSRLSETSFRDYEPVIAQIIATWPKVVKVEAQGKAPITVAARLRDAKLSFERYRWPTTLFDPAAFDKIKDSIRVAHKGDCVYAGSITSLKTLDVKDAQVATASLMSAIPLTVEITDNTQLRLIAWLAAKRAFAMPIILANIDEENAEWLEDNFDVDVTKNKDGSYTLL